MVRQRKKHHFWRNLLILLVLFGLFLCWDNSSIETDEVTFPSGTLPAGFDGCRIVHLSDLHGKYFGKDNERLYAALSAIAPTYYVTGNHEWGHGTAAVRALKSTLRESGVTVLSNEFVPLTRNGDTIVLAGIDDPNGYADQETPQELAQEVYAACGDPFWLLLAHRNDRFAREYSLLGADLTISGHGHGGIWRFPFTDGVFGTQRNLFPTHTAGFYSDNGASVFVSRGLGNSPKIVPRILNRPQVAVITLERG